MVVARLAAVLQRQCVDDRHEQFFAELDLAQTVQQSLVESSMMHDKDSSGEHVDDALHGLRGVHAQVYHGVGQTVYGGAVADVACRFDDVRLCCGQINHAIANEHPADAQHVRRGRIQAGRFDIDTNQFGLVEGRTGRRAAIA